MTRELDLTCGTPQRRGHVELPGPVGLHLEDVPHHDLHGLEILVGVEVAAVSRHQHQHHPQQQEDPVDVPDVPPQVHKLHLTNT